MSRQMRRERLRLDGVAVPFLVPAPYGDERIAIAPGAFAGSEGVDLLVNHDRALLLACEGARFRYWDDGSALRFTALLTEQEIDSLPGDIAGVSVCWSRRGETRRQTQRYQLIERAQLLEISLLVQTAPRFPGTFVRIGY